MEMGQILVRGDCDAVDVFAGATNHVLQLESSTRLDDQQPQPQQKLQRGRAGNLSSKLGRGDGWAIGAKDS